MVELRTALSSSGLKNVKTYIQSGNVIFGAKEQSHKNLELSKRCY
ncbi:DUF1697 domain-containing protein [Winogradskyella ursingii]